MSKIDKLLGRMRQNPRDWRIEDLESVTRRFGLGIRKSGGSHAVFYHTATGRMLTVPMRRPIKPVYIKAFLAMLDAIGGEHEKTEV